MWKVLRDFSKKIFPFFLVKETFEKKVRGCLRCQGSLFFVIKGETSLEKTQLLADFIKN